MTSPTDSNARGASKSVRIAGRSASGAGTRKARLRRAVLESLEDRTLLALLPPPSVTGRVDVSNSNGNESAPSIAVDPTNAQHVVSVWQRVDASLGLTPVIAEAAYSLDGGKSWAKFDLPAPLPDPALGPPTPGTPFAWTTDAGVAFDRSGDFYIVESQHDKLYAEGAIVLHKFSLTDTGPQQVFTNRVVYQWMGDTPDMAFTPTIAVDSGVGNQAVDMPVGSPADVLFAPNGSLYVSVENLNQVQKFNGTDGTFQNVFASGLGVFRPNDLTVSPVDGDLYISNRQDGNVLRVDGATGATKGVFTSPLKRFQAPGDAVIGLDGNLYVTSRDTDAVLRFNAQTGAFLGTFVPSRTGGLKAPEGLAFGVDGKLYVTSGGTNEVKRYDGLTGAFIDTFVPDTAGLDDPRGLAFGPDGNLYVSSFNTDAVLKFDRITGGSLGAFAAGATLDGPTSIAFGPDDGNLYVDSTNSDEVLRFSGLNGAFLSTFIPAGTGGLKAPEGLVFRPNGLYVGSGGTDAVLRFNPRTGALVGTFIKPGDGGLDGPSGIAFATGGDAFVASRNSNQVYRYGAASGTFKNTITPEPLKTPRYSTVGPDGNVYVTSRDTDSVVRYDGLTGQFLGTFVASGSGGLDQPSGLTFGLDGNLYVADGFNNRILKFNGFTGQFLGVFVTTAGNGGLEGVQAIAYGGDGNLYAASNATDSVLKYNGVDGTFLGIFTPAPLRTPEDAVIGPDGKLYVSSRNLNEVLRYDGTTGDFLDVFVQPKAGGLTTARGLAFAANGDLLVSSFDTNQVLRYKASDGSFVGDFIPVPLKAPEGAVLGPDGDLYVAASDSDRILRYNGTTGAFDRIFASSADSPLTKPIGLAFHNGDLFVASRDSGQILRYNGTTGAYLGPFVDAGGSLNIPSEIVFGPDGNLYVSDLGTDEVHRYNGTTGADMGVFVAAGAGGLNGPRGLAFDGAGRLYVASSNTDQVLRYLGTSGAFDSVFVGGTLTAPVPVGLAFRAGNLYVSSATTNRIYRYDATGTFIDIFVPAGQGGLVAPSGLAFTAGGDLLVAGKGTDRVLLFKGTNGSWVKDFTPTPLTHPTGITRGPDGNVYVSSRDGNFVAKYDGNGAYLGQFTPEPLVQPEGAVLSKDGLSLFVAHSASNEILRYDAATGAFLGIFVTKGSGGLSKPTDLTIDATGDLYVISSGTDEVLRYDAATGAFKSTFVSAGKGGLAGAAGLKFDVAGNLFVSSSGTNQVMRYDNTGASSPSAGNTGAIFVIAGAGGLGFPAGLDILGTRLYVASRGTNQILSYDLTSGAGATTFVGTGNGLSQPREIVWGADGKLYVESFGSNSVLRYDGTGKFIDTFVTTGSGGLNSPSGMLFLGGNLLLSSTGTDAVLKYAGADGKFQGAFTAEALRAPEDVQFLPDGSLLVASNGGNSVLRFNGATGASLGAFIPAGSGGLAAPQSIAVDIAGNVYVTSETGHAVLRYDGTTGAFANVFVPAGAGGLKTPQGLVFAADGSLLVASFGSDEILRYAAGTGAVLGPFTPAALQKPSGILFGPDGKLYVSSETRDYVVRYDGISGKFDRIFTSASLKAPRDAVLGPDGKLYVASQDTNEILRYDGATGAFIDVFVSKGSGGLSQPHGLAFGKDGNLYVSSFATNQILRYRGTTGAFMNVFASAAINQPEGLTFGPDNNLYVASSGNNQVLRYRAASGAFLGAFATAGLSSPRGVTFGADGNLYVASFGTNQVLSYKGGTGALIGAFVAAGSGGLIGPGNIAFGPDGSLYVNSIGNNEVIRYSGATGAFLDVVVPTSRGGLNGATGLTFTADGGGLLVGSLNTDQILQYDINNGAFLGPFTPGALRDPTGLAFDAAGNLYVSSFTTDTVLKYAAGTGRLLSNFVPAGSGALDGPVGLTFLNGRLFVAGSLGDNVIRYGASDGTFLDALNPTRPNAPADSVIGPDGLLYVSSRDSDSVLRYDPATGRLLGTFVTPKAGGLKQPQGLAFGADGNLYVASTGTNAVLRFNGRTGVFLDTFVAAGTGGLARPQGLVFGPDGNLYVASFDQDAVLRFRGSTGAFLSTFVPSGNGKLDGPTSLAFLPNGDLLVASYNNDSILRYKVGTAQFLGAFVPQGSNGLDGPVSIIIGPDKNLYVASDAASPAFIIPDLAADTNRDNRVLRFDGITGAFLGAFVARGDGGMQGPAGLSFGPDGSLYVSDRGNNRILRFNGITGAFDKALDIINDPYGIVFGPDVNGDGRPELYAASINTDSIVRYDGVTGEYLDTLVTPRSGGLRAPKDLRFGPDGNLYVSSSGNNQVLKYNSMTGAFLGVAASGGGLANPEGLAFDSLGRLYVASRTTSSVLRYNPTTGAFIDAFVAPGAGGLVEPRGLNFAADGSLEIASYGTNKVLRYDSSGAYVGVFTHAAAQAFTDPDSKLTQNNKWTGNVYISWATNLIGGPVNGVANPNPSAILLVASSDGGNSFSPPTVVNDSKFTSPIELDAQPKLAVSQGTIDGKIAPGQVSVIWDDFGSGNLLNPLNPPRDFIRADRVMPGSTGAATMAFAKDDIKSFIASTSKEIATTTRFALPVAVTDPRFTTLSHLDVRLSLVHPDLSQLEIDIIAPNGTRVPLVRNPNLHPGAVGITGDRLGGPDDYIIDTIFDQSAPRSIADPTFASPYIGRFVPDTDPGDSKNKIPPGLTLDAFNGMTRDQIGGFWTLEITDFSGADAVFPDQRLVDWGIDFTSNMKGSTDSLVGTTFVTGRLTGATVDSVATTGPYDRSPAAPLPLFTATTPIGIGPGATIAADNTLGSFSARQGRIYAAYTQYDPFRAFFSDDTDIVLVSSDNGGITWSPEKIVNDDNGQTDGFSESLNDPNFTKIGRPQYEPSIAVDPTTGFVALSFYDARNDASRARVATYVAVSGDGGDTFAPQVFANTPNTALDAISRKTVVLGPIPDNQSPRSIDPFKGNSLTDDKFFSYGDHQALAFYAGRLYPAWSGNENGGIDGAARLDIRVASVLTTAGPRVLSSTMGPVRQETVHDLGGAPIDFNNLFDATGAPIADGFVVEFDRPIDANSFDKSDVKISYRNVATSGFAAGVDVPPLSVLPLLEGNTPQGPTKFLVRFTPSSATGTYSYSVGPFVTDRIRSVVGTTVIAGNAMDQNANGSAGEDPAAGPIIGTAPGDVYAAPTPAPKSSTTFFGAEFTPPYDRTTQPLIVPGPHVVRTFVPGSTPTVDNLVLDGTVSQLAVVFDRDMKTSLPATSVVRIVGPAGEITGPFSIVHDPADSTVHPRVFLVNFPSQQLSGTYTVVLGADMQSAAGEPMDNNLNAGLDVLRGDPSQGLTTLTTVSSDPIPPVIGGATAGLTAKSKITISDDFLVAGVTLTISVTYPNDPDLSAVLRSPDGTVVRLFTAVGSTGTKTNFTNTTFDDAATTPIQNGGPPFFGRFNPQEPLSAFKNHTSKGAWTLEITDSVAGRTGAITGWTLNLLKPISGTGLGEIVADQSTASFRIFTFNPTNPLSGNVWTAVGPAGIGAKGPGLNAEVSGRVGALATDPSDPSGNTVYLGAASGGVWKTTNFLTTSPAGPTYVPLTDFGPTFGLNIGGLAVFGRNNNPNQSIVFAGTGEGAALGFGIPGRPTRGDSPVMSVRGVGFLRSLDGGSSWTLLDSTVNFDAQGNPLPLNSPLRDHIFVGTTTYRVVVDPTPTPGGETIIYAALSDVDSNGQPVTGGGRSGGIWRSVDTGKTWQRMRAGQATDVILDYASGTGAPGGNIQIIYAAFRGEGVFSSPNRGQVFNLMTGTTGNPLILAGGSPPSPVGVLAAKSDYYAGQATPNGAGKGRIILSRPSLTGNPLEDTLYQGWLYAAVVSSPSIVTADNQLVKGGHLEGLYLTKDFGQNWTRVRIPSVSYGDHTGPRVPSNDDRLPDYDPLGEETPYGEAPDIADPADLDLDNAGFGNYSFALAVDPNNPNVVYLGGTDKYHYSGLLRIDTTGIADPHAFYISNTDSEGKIWDNTQVADATGGERRVFPNDPNPAAAQHSAVTLSFGPSTNAPVPPFNPVTSPVLNLISDPLQPFLVGSTILTTNAAFFNNTGAQVKWIPFDKAVKPDPFNNDPNDPWSLAASGQHQILAVKDQITGRTRLIFGNDEGVYTAVDQGNGKLLGSLGSVSSLDTPTGDVTIVNGSRNGNLQTTQFYYGAVQPSNLAAQASQLQGMFYGTTEATGTPNSNPNIINVGQPGYGNLSWTRPNVIRATGTGIGIVQTGPSEPGFAAVYRYLWPSEVDNAVATDFFQRDQTSRTFNLLQNTAGQIDPLTGPVFDVPDGQWPFRKGYNFAVNPINGDQIVISSEFGRLFSTENAGKFWNVIGQPGSLDGSNAQALAFGAPDPNGPGGSGNLNAFVYAGTIRGNVFVTFTGGGTQGNQWTNISSGLDGTPVQAIVTNPTRGSHEAYAVTQANVYHMVDSSVPGASWTKITSNLFALTASLFGNPAQVDQRERNLTSIAADWRYLVPDDLNNPTGPSHPLLYVGGEGGVVRSLDDGKSWSLFPSPDPSGLSTTPTPPGVGGGMPNVLVTDLDLSLGQINPTTGRPNVSTGPNVLVAATFGRGQFAIRLSPIVFPTTVALDPASDSGQSATDRISNVLRPILTGFSAQSAFGQIVTVDLLDLTDPNNPVVIGTGQTDSAGRFSVQVNANVWKSDGTSDGVKAIGVQATDQSGAKGNVVTLTYTLDTQAPAGFGSPDLTDASDTGPSNTDNYTSVVNPIFNVAIAGAADLVQLRRAGVVVASRTGAGLIQDPGPVADGTYSYTIVLTDPAGNVSAPSAGLSVTVDTKAPAATLAPDLQAASDSGPSSTDNYTNVTAPTFDLLGVEANATAQLLRNGSVIASRVGPGALQDPGPLADGVYNYTVIQTDRAGNAAAESAILQITVDTNVNAPGTPDLQSASDSGISSVDNLTSVVTPRFDVAPAEAGAVVTLYRDGSAIAVRTGPGALQDPGPITEATHVYTSRQVDQAGNLGPFSNGLTVRFDFTAPIAPPPPVLQPGSDSGAFSDDAITNVTKPVFDVAPSEAGGTLQLLRDGTVVASRSTAGPLTDPGTVADGSHSYTTRQVDAAGNVGPVSIALTVIVDTAAPAAPIAPDLQAGSDTGPSSTDNITRATAPRFDLVATESTATLQLLRKLASAGVGSYAVVASRTGTGALSDPGPVPDGAYTYAVRQVDVAGNMGALGAELLVTIDATAPTAPAAPDLQAASDTGPSNTDNFTSVTAPTFDVTVAETGALVELLRDGKVVASRTGVGAIADPGVAADGTYLYTTRQTDLAGNVSPISVALSVTIDTTVALPSVPDLTDASDTGVSITDNITSVTSPIFTIASGEAGATIQLMRNGIVVATWIGPGNVQDTGPVASGVYSYTSKQIDQAGNVSAVSAALTVTIDTGAPTTPSAPDLQAASDSGVSSTDNYTNAIVPVFDTLATETTATLQLLRKPSASPVGSYVVVASITGSGAMTDLGPVPDGVYSYALRQVDVAGNASSIGAALTVTVDTTAPVAPDAPDLQAASDSGASNTDNITATVKPTFTVSPAEATATVQLLRDGVVVAVRSGAGSIQEPTALADAAYAYSARQIDLAGNVGPISSSLSVTIDTTPPVASSVPDLLDAGDSGASNTDNITNVVSPTFAVSTAEATATVQLYRNGILVGTRIGPGNILDTSVTTPDGNYIYTSRQVDPAGNAGPFSAGLTVTVDTTAPSSPAAPDLQPSSDSGTSNVDNVTNITNPQFDVAGVDAGVTLRLLRDGVVVATVPTGAGGTITIRDPGPVAGGVHVYTASEIDVAGNLGSEGAPLNVTIDTSAPAFVPGTPDLQAVSDSGPSNTDDYTASTKLFFNLAPVETGVLVQLLRDGVVVAARTGPGAVQDAGPVAEGVHLYTARELDAAGNPGTPSAPLTVTVDVTAPTAPEAPDLQAVSDSGSSNTDNITNTAKPSFDVTGVEATATAQLLRNGVVVASRVGAGAIQDPGPLLDGTYVFTVRQTDLAGNTGPAGAALSVTIDTTAPSIPGAPDLQTASDSGSSSLDNITSNTAPTFDITPADTGVVVQLYRSGVLVGTRVGPGPIQDGGPVADGVYVYTARQLDPAGNLSQPSVSLQVTIDTTEAAPAAPVLQASSDTGPSNSDGYTSVNRPTFDLGTADPTALIQLFRDGKLVGSRVGSGPLQDATGLADGVYVYTTRQTDLAGNLSPASAGLTVTIDAAAPVAPSMPDLQDASDSGSSKTDNITNINRPTFDIAGVESTATVQLFRAGVLVGTRVGPGPIQDATALVDGVYSYTAKQIDLAGNPSGLASALAVTIDTTPPAKPGAPDLQPGSDSGSSNTDNITNAAKPTFDVSGVETKATVQLYRGAVLAGSGVGTAAIQDQGPLNDGFYVYTLKQLDVAGNVSEAGPALQVTIDTIAPAGPALVVTTDPANPRRPRATGSTEPKAPVDLLDGDGKVLASGVAGTDGKFVLQPTSDLPIGLATLSARARDIAGNQGIAGPGSTYNVAAPARTVGDFDGDGKGDLVSFNRASGQWSIRQSSGGARQFAFGDGTIDVPLTGDFDGDGRADFAVFRTTTAQWLILLSGGGVSTPFFGAQGDIPVPADYDGDGRTDFAVFRPTTAQWFILQSSGGGRIETFGAQNIDKPVPADFDGDGRADLGVFRSTNGQWLILQSGGGAQTPVFGDPSIDVPVPADYDGDRKADLAVYRRTNSQFLILKTSGGAVTPVVGAVGDSPAPLDYDGDGKVDPATFRPSNAAWTILASATNTTQSFTSGNTGDVPVAAPYDYRRIGGVKTSGIRVAGGQADFEAVSVPNIGAQAANFTQTSSAKRRKGRPAQKTTIRPKVIAVTGSDHSHGKPKASLIDTALESIVEKRRGH